MLKYIKKRDGRREKFNPSKIHHAVLSAALQVYPTEEHYTQCENLANSVEKRMIHWLESEKFEKMPNVEDIQDRIVKLLVNSREDKIAEAYILYRAERTRQRDSRSRLMKKIEEITFADAKESNLKRDNANVDGNTAMGTMLQYGSAVSKQFSDDFMLRADIKKAVDNGDIYIHDKDFLPMGTTTCTQIELDRLFENGFNTGHGFLREPQDITSYAALTAIAIQSNQNDQHGGQSIPMFDYYMAPGVKKTFTKMYIDNIYKYLNINGLCEDYEQCKGEIFAFTKENCYPHLQSALTSHWYQKCNQLLTDKYRMSQHESQKAIHYAQKEATRETEKKTYQAMEGLVHNLNTMHSRAGAQVPFSSINFGTDTTPEGRMVSKNLLLAQEAGLGDGETPIFPILIFKVKEGINYNKEDTNYDLFQLSLQVSAKRLFPNFVFIDAPFNLQYYKPDDPRTEIATMGCRTRVMGNINGEEVSCGRGNLSFNTINLPRLGIKYGCFNGKKANMKEFYHNLDFYIDSCVDALLERYEIQKQKKVKNFPFLMGQHIWKNASYTSYDDELQDMLASGTLSVGFIGLAECLTALIGKHHGESEEAQQLGLEIIGHMRAKMDEATEKHQLNFSLLATPAEGLSGYFTKIDKVKYGILAGITDKDYYTNSFHIPVSYQISIAHKIELEAPYHALCNAGHITYVEVAGDLANNLPAFEAVVRKMKESGIGYGSVNHPVDRDPICGYSGVIEGHVCPNCGRDERVDGIAIDRIRRITGYLVGTLERFNDGKSAEEKDRIKHTN